MKKDSFPIWLLLLPPCLFYVSLSSKEKKKKPYDSLLTILTYIVWNFISEEVSHRDTKRNNFVLFRI